MYFSFCVHMMVENNNKTMGLADCSDNLVLPSVESAEFVNSCGKNTSVKHVKKMQSWTLNKSAKVTWTRVETHAGEKLPLWRNKSSDGDRIIKSPKSVGKHKRNTHKPQKNQQTWNKSISNKYEVLKNAREHKRRLPVTQSFAQKRSSDRSCLMIAFVRVTGNLLLRLGGAV